MCGTHGRSGQRTEAPHHPYRGHSHTYTSILSPKKKETGLWAAPREGVKADTPQSAPRAVICRHGFGGAHTHTHKDPQDSNKSEPVASSHSPNRRVRHSPGGPFPALPRRARGAGGEKRRNCPLCPRGTRGRRARPRGCAGGQDDAGAAVPRRRARPSRPRGWHRPQRPGEEGWGSEFTISPSPPLPPAGTAAMAPRPACGGPAVSLLWSLGAVEQLPLLGPRPVLRAGIPLPSEEMRRRPGVCEQKESGGEWGAKR